MPNYVKNVCKIKNIPKDKIQYMLNKITVQHDDNQIIDFDLIIPEPRFKIDCPKNHIRNEKSCVEIDKDRPWFNWYDWRVEYWGTKWNACDGYTLIGNDLTLVFDTAWSMPYPIIQELIKICEQNGFDLELLYADEDYGRNCGKLIYDHITRGYCSL